MPLALRIFHDPTCAPGAAGAAIGTETSTVEPGDVGGTMTTVLPVMASPATKTN